MASLVCKKCLEDDPSRIDLITCKCFHESLHLKEPRVQVVLAPSNSRLERFIPPTFDVKHTEGGKLSRQRKPRPAATAKHEEANVQESAPLTRLEKDFDVKKCLGKGGFGVVYHVKAKIDCKEYAIKIIKLPSSESDQEKVRREAKVLAQMDHHRIVRYFSSWIEMAPPGWENKKIWEDLKSSEIQPRSPDEANKVAAATVAPAVPLHLERPTCLFIQTEYCKAQTLYHWLRENINNRPKKTVTNYFEQILEAVVYIHGEDLVHRDLTPSNIFFSDIDNLKVGDFGLVTAAAPSDLTPSGCGTDSQSSCSSTSSGSSTSNTSVVGTRLYMSPEQLAGKQIPRKQIQKVDVFALGVIFFELCYPLSTEHERVKVLTDVREQKIPQEFTNDHPKEAELIRTLLDPDPSRRPTAQQVYNLQRASDNQSTESDEDMEIG